MASPNTGSITQTFRRYPYQTTGKLIKAQSEGDNYEKSIFWSSDNGYKVTMAMWLRNPSGNSGQDVILRNESAYPIVLTWDDWDDVTNKFTVGVTYSGTSGYIARTLTKADHGISIGDWFALMISVDYSASGVPPTVEIWVQKKGATSATDIKTTPIYNTNGPRTISFSNPSIVHFGSAGIWSTETDFEASELFMDGPDDALDWSNPANRLKFVDASGFAVDQGATGSALLGHQPKIYAPDADLSNNLGSAGNFIENGTIDASSTSPSNVASPWLFQSAIGQSWEFGGTIAQTLPFVSQAAQALYNNFPCFCAQILPAITSAGIVEYTPGTDTGAISQILPVVFTSYSDVRYFVGTKLSTSAQYLWPVTSVSTATYEPGISSAASTQVLPTITSAATGEVLPAFFCTSAQVLAAITSASTATFAPGSSTGSATHLLSAVNSTSTATYEHGTKTGIIWLQTLPLVTSALTGEVWETAIGDQILPSVTSAGTATFVPGIKTAAISQNLWPITTALTGQKVKSAIITQNISAVAQASTAIYEPGSSQGAIVSVLPLTTQAGTAHYEPGTSTGPIIQMLYTVQQDMLGIFSKAIASPQLLYEQQVDELIYEVPEEIGLLVSKGKIL